MANEFTFNKMKPSDYVVALSDDEGTKVGYPYKVVSIWRDENDGVGITVELSDGCGAGLNEGEYTPLHTRTAPKVKPLVFVEDGDRWLTRRAEGYVITTHTVSPYWGVNDPHGNDLGVYDLLQYAEDAAQKDWREFLSHHIE